MTARHEFDFLPTDAAIEVRPARYAEMPAVAAMARQMVPGVQIGEQGLLQHYLFDAESILVFSDRGRLLGGMAFLYLNAAGHDGLILGELTPTHPDRALLARQDDEVSATYIWAIGARGRGLAGLGKAAAHLRGPRYINADCFAQPSTEAGRALMIATGFKPMPSFQPDLWCYERPWKRALAPAPMISTGSFSDARH